MTIAAQQIPSQDDALAAHKIVRATQQLHDLIDGYGEENDRKGQLAEPVVEALHTANVIGILSPRELGGAELSPRQAMDVIRTLSYADPATGWVAFALAFATGLAGAFLDRATAEELFAIPRMAVAGQGTRPCKASAVNGGYLITGDWSFGSGIKHATHVVAPVIDTASGQALCAFLPREQAELIDNWDVLGLRGTGSIDYRLREVFVPANYTFSLVGMEPELVTGGALYRIGLGDFASINHGAWALGTGRRLLDELAVTVRDKAGHAAGDAFTEDYAEAETKLRSAKAFLYEVWEEIEEELARGARPTVRHATLNRMALNNATWRAQEVAQFVYASSGTAALRSGTIQRLVRDMHGGTQHISSARVILQSAGRELTGLAEGQRWVHHMLK